MAKLPKGLTTARVASRSWLGVDTHLTTAISCVRARARLRAPPGVVPSTVEAYGAPDLASLKVRAHDQITSFHAQPGACTAVPQEGTWNFTETRSVINGQIVCYTTPAGSFLLWSYERPCSMSGSAPGPYADLFKYWQDAALHLP